MIQLHQYGVQPSTVEVSAASAEDFRFDLPAYLGAAAATLTQLTVGDGAQVIPDEDNTAGKQEVCKSVHWTAGIIGPALSPFLTIDTL